MSLCDKSFVKLHSLFRKVICEEFSRLTAKASFSMFIILCKIRLFSLFGLFVCLFVCLFFRGCFYFRKKHSSIYDEQSLKTFHFELWTWLSVSLNLYSTRKDTTLSHRFESFDIIIQWICLVLFTESYWTCV